MSVQIDRERASAQMFVQSADAPWEDAAFSGHYWLRLTPAELVELGQEIEALMLRWRRREIPDDGASERQAVLAFARAFPSQP
jgi:hypothetical protein